MGDPTATIEKIWHKIGGELHEVMEMNYGTNRHPLILYTCPQCRKYLTAHEIIKRKISYSQAPSKAKQKEQIERKIEVIKKELRYERSRI